MTKVYKVEIKGMGNNEFVPPGVWLTRDELDRLLEQQYDNDMCDRVVCLGGKYFRPRDFRNVIEVKELAEVLESDSPLVDSEFIESLAVNGYLEEVVDNCPVGYKNFVQKLVESGKYQLGTGDKRSQINYEGIKKFEEMKKQHRLGRGDEL